ncbi:MAG: hypothetical protein CVU62_12680 [Deltaproteobacteria bacterium HGW-Deltaproteobacteria-2]|nr:MAG: hypothetical protein CVU62_12680 [Deltaproteobacteria bacterium HGW-Deltaproteobacteria-2]
MKQMTTKSTAGFQRLAIPLIILLLAIFQLQPALALPISDNSNAVATAAMKLVQFGSDPKARIDTLAVATLVDYVLGAKPNKETDLPSFHKAPGAYYEFDTRISISKFLQYSYSNQIPSVFTSPSSLRYSLCNIRQGKLQQLSNSGILALPDSKPTIIRGLQRDAITPDLTTGVYYEYDLNRTFILLNHKGRQTLITVSQQINISDVGKKGVILGNDEDWNYYYSDEPGSTKAFLGWVKSYIYDYFSVAVYVETGSSPSMFRTGVFQWIRAGWSGVNFVQPKHIIRGIKRYAKSSKSVLESPNLPALNQIASAYQQLSSLSRSDLLEKYMALQQARQSLAVQSGKIETNKIKKQDSFATTPKEQIVEELMLEYLKVALGKPSLLGNKVIHVLSKQE